MKYSTQSLDNSLRSNSLRCYWSIMSLSFALISVSSGLGAYQSYQKHKAETSVEQSRAVTNTTTNLESTVEAGK